MQPKKHPQLKAACLFLILTSVISILPIFVQPVYFMESDDYLLNYIANGSYGTSGSAHMVYIHMLFGGLMKLLYAITNHFNWYAILLVGLIILSFTGICYTIYELGKHLLLLIPILIFDALMVPFFLTYTAVAFVTVGAGFALWYLALMKPQGLRLYAALGSLFLILGYNLRADTLIPAAALMCPLFLHAGIKRFHKELLVPVAAFVVVFAAFVLVDKVAYSSPEWHDFMNYTDARSGVVDHITVNYQDHAEEFSSIGLSEVDYTLLTGWKMAEKNVFSEDTLLKTADITAKSITTARRIKYTRAVLGGYTRWYLLLPAILFLMLFFLTEQFPLIPALCALALNYGIVFALAFIRMRFVERVALPILVLALVTQVLIAAGCRLRPARRILSVLMSGMFAVLFLGTTYAYVRGYNSSALYSRGSLEDYPKKGIADEIAAHPNDLYVCDAGVLSALYYFGTPIRQVDTTERFANIARSGSWDSYSPRYYAQVSRFSKDPDNLLTSLVTEDCVHYVAAADAGMAAFLSEQTGRNVTYDVQSIDGLSSKIITYHFAD